jgi:acylphosphatase
MKKLSATVKGRVQGVGYRMFARDAARRLSLSGYVQNLPDGTVFVSASGVETDLHDLVLQLQRGPWGARVERVDCEWSEVAHSETTGFEVRA